MEKNQWIKGKTLSEIAREPNQGIIDAFLDLVVEEQLGTIIRHARGNADQKAMTQILNFPAGGWRVRELSERIKCTFVNGEVLIENGKHTGALPGRVMRNALYQANHQ